MINSAKEAREIIENGKIFLRQRIRICELEYAHAYIAVLEGPEVTALVEAQQKAIHIIKSLWRDGKSPGLQAVQVLIVSVAQYREALKP